MIKPIIHDPIFLAQKSEKATRADAQVITDLKDTLMANAQHCVGVAAHYIYSSSSCTILICTVHIAN